MKSANFYTILFNILLKKKTLESQFKGEIADA